MIEIPLRTVAFVSVSTKAERDDPHPVHTCDRLLELKLRCMNTKKDGREDKRDAAEGKIKQE